MNLAIGEKIALLRQERNITQTQLAEYLFLAPQTVSRWEVGNGAPEITLLPRIAAFFGVSIDELFGATSRTRTEDLVAKYSVLRDGRSFREAMGFIDSQIQSIDALLKNGGGDLTELEEERDQLEAEKTHMWIQLGREAFQRAFAIADRFAEKTEGDPEHPWYLKMRLQRDQLCDNIGRGRETVAQRRADFMERPSQTSLLRYFAMLGNRQDYEEILEAAEGPAREMLFPPATGNLPIWLELIHAAAETGERGLIEQHLPQVLEVCGKQDEVDFLLCLLNVYEGEELARVKERLRSLLPQAGLNEYFEAKVRERIGATPAASSQNENGDFC